MRFSPRLSTGSFSHPQTTEQPYWFVKSNLAWPSVDRGKTGIWQADFVAGSWRSKSSRRTASEKRAGINALASRAGASNSPETPYDMDQHRRFADNGKAPV